MQKLSDKKIKVISRSGQHVSGPVAPKKGSAFLGFFTFSKAETQRKKTATILKEPVLKNPQLHVSRADFAAVKNWVALEEKIVHEYKEQKTDQAKSTDPLAKSPAKQLLPAFETFSTQTAVSLSPSVSRLKNPPRGSKGAFSGVAGFFLVCGWLAAGVFVLLHFQETFSNREISQKLTRLRNEEKKLEQSYAALKNASEDQNEEIKWLNSQRRGLAVELKTAKADQVAYEQSLEKKYREELMRITVRYESELAALRGAVETQRSIMNALKAQGQAFEKIVDQVGMSALSGAAAGLSQGPFSTGETSMLQGEITSVNARQGFVVINMGSAQGARSGRRITIFRSGTQLTTGRIDRVYPSMSAVLVRDAGMLQAIQEGDSVSFS